MPLRSSQLESENDVEVTSTQHREDDESEEEEREENERNVATTSRKSAVWDYFVSGDDNHNRTAACNLCSTILKLPLCTTTPMFNHLRAKHTEEWGDVKKKASKRRSDEANPGAKRRKTEMSAEDRKELDELLMEMIATDMKPFSCVEDRGFPKLLERLAPDYKPPHRTTFSRRLAPNLFYKTKERLTKSLSEDIANGIMSFSFTTDGWKSRADHHYLTLTLHYMNQNFEMNNITLGMVQLEGSHTGILLRSYIENMMADWNLLEIEDAPIFFVTDNARNISSAVHNRSWNHVACFAHTLQLALKDAKQRSVGVSELLKKARRIATHFHHSVPARREFEATQKEFSNQQCLKLIQMVETRWNSEYEMLARMLKLKAPLTQVLARSTVLDPLTRTEWNNIRDLVEVMKPLYEATVISCGMTYPTLSMIIPILRGIKHALETLKTGDIDLGDMANDLSDNICDVLDIRFCEIHSEDLHKKATFLDPRYRGYFLDPDALKLIQSALSDEIIAERSRQNGDAESVPLSQEPSVSREKTTFWNFMQPSTSNRNREQSNLSLTVKQEMLAYTHGTLLEHYGDPISWWKAENARFSNLSLMARRYLPIPATSVESERLFSSAGDIVTDARSRLLPESVEHLIFLYKNLT